LRQRSQRMALQRWNRGRRRLRDGLGNCANNSQPDRMVRPRIDASEAETQRHRRIVGQERAARAKRRRKSSTRTLADISRKGLRSTVIFLGIIITRESCPRSLDSASPAARSWRATMQGDHVRRLQPPRSVREPRQDEAGEMALRGRGIPRKRHCQAQDERRHCVLPRRRPKTHCSN